MIEAVRDDMHRVVEPLSTRRLTSRCSGPGPPRRDSCCQRLLRRAGALSFSVRRREVSGLATAIERLLYGDRVIHGVAEFTTSPGVVRLRLTPWEGPQIHTVVVFHRARLTSAEAYPANPGDLDLPWDIIGYIIGFDRYGLGGGLWRFVLHCDAIEWCFESAWPVVGRADA